jgi:F-type H+-transporting ATPase subunit a
MEISINAETVFMIGDFPVTNSMLATSLVVIVLAIVTFLGTRKMKNRPKGLQNILEMVVESIHNLTHNVIDNKKVAKVIFPLIATFFIFIIVNNWAGLIPGFGSIGVYELKEGHEVFVPLLRSANADLNTTIMLSLLSVIVIQIIGIGVVGVKSYGKKFFNFSSPILFFVGILELISEFIKIISFSFRLFGNVFAGEVLLIVITMLVPYILPMPFYGLELFVGFIQALVFTMLTLVFIKMATIEAH